MSGMASAPHNGIKGQSKDVGTWNSESEICTSGDEAESVKASESVEWALDIHLSDAVGVGTSVRPGRSRNRTKAELEEKTRKPAEDVRKKSPPARKAPARGRYVDEYARPAL